MAVKLTRATERGVLLHMLDVHAGRVYLGLAWGWPSAWRWPSASRVNWRGLVRRYGQLAAIVVLSLALLGTLARVGLTSRSAGAPEPQPLPVTVVVTATLEPAATRTVEPTSTEMPALLIPTATDLPTPTVEPEPTMTAVVVPTHTPEPPADTPEPEPTMEPPRVVSEVGVNVRECPSTNPDNCMVMKWLPVGTLLTGDMTPTGIYIGADNTEWLRLANGGWAISASIAIPMDPRRPALEVVNEQGEPVG
jgi:hypothetical protein